MRITAGSLLTMTMLLLLETASVSAAEGPKTYPLWPDGAPGALGKETGDEFHPGDIPTITVYTPDATKANGARGRDLPGRRLWLPRHRARGERRRRVAQHARRHGSRAQVPARAALPAPGHARGRPARHPHGPSPGQRVAARPRPGRRPRLLRRWPPRLDRRHPLRFRPARCLRSDRPPELPPRPCHPGLPRRRPGHALRPYRLAQEPARRPARRRS